MLAPNSSRENKGVVILRCDAGARHGLGHLSRCLTLAAGLRDHGFLSQFVLHAPKNIRNRVIGAGFECIEAVAEVGHDAPPEWLSARTCLIVIDSKQATLEYVHTCRARGRVLCFDDETARDLPCDILVNNNLWADAESYHDVADRILLLGPTYNTVSPAYFALEKQLRDGLLITLGGEDPENHTEQLISSLASTIGDRPTHICIGPAHPDRESVSSVCRRKLPHAVLYFSPSTLVEVASKCCMAITAGGTTCYELAAAGIAMAIIAVEDHQFTLQKSMEQAGAAISAGGGSTFSQSSALSAFSAICDSETAARLVCSAKRLFPEPGVRKIIDALSNELGGRAFYGVR